MTEIIGHLGLVILDPKRPVFWVTSRPMMMMMMMMMIVIIIIIIMIMIMIASDQAN